MISLRLQDQWFLAAGTLIGSLEHHDIIPWDDDVDVCMHLRHRRLVQEALGKLAPTFLTYAQKTRDKFYFMPFDKRQRIDANSIGSYAFSNYPWAWPAIDICYFYELDANTGQELGEAHHKFNLTNLFPLTYRPFGKHWYPAPRRPISFSREFYSTRRNHCPSNRYSHILEKSVTSKSVDCRRLMRKYAFVHRCPVPPNSIGLFFSDEYLVEGGGRSLHKIRTILDPDEVDSPLYTAKHKSFRCPTLR